MSDLQNLSPAERVRIEELRAVCDCPTRFQLLDGLGIGLGTYFALDGARRFNKQGERPFAMANIALGGLMLWIHAQRFRFGSELGIRIFGSHNGRNGRGPFRVPQPGGGR